MNITERNELITQNIGLARDVAHKYPYLDYDEAFQNACLGLIYAAEKYNESKGKFSTFAYKYCVGYVINEAKKELNYISITEDITEFFNLEAEDNKDVNLDSYNFKPYQKSIIELLFEGYNQTEIARFLDMSQAGVSRELNKIRKILLLEL